MNSHLLDKGEVCRYFGGSKPINVATLYRGIRQGRYPRPVKVGGLSRWLRCECEQVLQAMVNGRVS
jgi:predicted DNA-binding transcriptional regulator AlpA